jgi:hypothetical protein
LSEGGSHRRRAAASLHPILRPSPALAPSPSLSPTLSRSMTPAPSAMPTACPIYIGAPATSGARTTRGGTGSGPTHVPAPSRTRDAPGRTARGPTAAATATAGSGTWPPATGPAVRRNRRIADLRPPQPRAGSRRPVTVPVRSGMRRAATDRASRAAPLRRSSHG